MIPALRGLRRSSSEWLVIIIGGGRGYVRIVDWNVLLLLNYETSTRTSVSIRIASRLPFLARSKSALFDLWQEC